MKSYILWDHDGVLVDTEPWYFEATRRHIEPLGVDLRLADYLADMAVGRAAWDRARELGATDAQIAAGRRARNVDYQRHLREENIEIAGVIEVLEILARRFAMAIVTTAKKDDFELIHRHRNIAPHMDFVLANGDYPRSKPAPDPYQAALARFGAEPHEAIVVEDSERGLRSAIAAGIDCVVVASEFVRGQDFSRARYRIDSLAELPVLLASL
ncbi:MAG: HAD family phosphatase [Gammaproteobacteria bacterium]|nr:HAD family phosphatase [Gammaproteobacteria bacterium]